MFARRLLVFATLTASHQCILAAPSPAGTLCGVGGCVRRIFGGTERQEPSSPAHPQIAPEMAQHIHQILPPPPPQQPHVLPLPPVGPDFWGHIGHMMPDHADDEQPHNPIFDHPLWADAPRFQFTTPHESFRVEDSGPLIDSAGSSPVHSGLLTRMRQLRAGHARDNQTGWRRHEEGESSSMRVPSLHLPQGSDRWLPSEVSGSPRSHISDEGSPRSQLSAQSQFSAPGAATPIHRAAAPAPMRQPPARQVMPEPQPATPTPHRVRPQPRMTEEMFKLYEDRGWGGPLRHQPVRNVGPSRTPHYPSDASVMSDSGRLDSGRFSAMTSPEGSPERVRREQLDKGKGKAPMKGEEAKQKGHKDASSSDSDDDVKFEPGSKEVLPKPIIKPFGPGSSTQHAEGHKLPMPPIDDDRRRDILRLGMPSPLATPHAGGRSRARQDPNWPGPFYGPLQRSIPPVERTDSAPPTTRQRLRRPPRPRTASRLSDASHAGAASDDGGGRSPSPPRPQPLPRPPSS